jgi:DNA-directed RNA polymerase specialized sigma24 family protein
VLLLRFAAGLDASEAGRVMGKKPNAIRQLQFRALTNVRALMMEGSKQ